MTEVREVNISVPKKAVVINKYTEGGGGWIYFLGLIGAVVYYFGNANGFSEYVVGFLKALVWPAYLAYYALNSFGL